MDIVEEMRGFEIDHEPDGWLGVRMRQVSALCDEIERLRRELGQWKNNHAVEVRRARILKERTDMPIDRVQAYEKWGEDMADAQRYRFLCECDTGNLHYWLYETQGEIGSDLTAGIDAAMATTHNAGIHRQDPAPPA